MTTQEKAAFINAQIEMMRAESETMKAENVERERHGQAPANGPQQWAGFRERWEPIMGYNALIKFFNQL